MIMTDLAVKDIEMRSETLLDRCRRAFVDIFGRSSNHQLPVEVALRDQPALHALPASPENHKPLRVVEATETAAESPEK